VFRPLTRRQLTVDIVLAAMFFLVATSLTVVSAGSIMTTRMDAILAVVLVAMFSVALAVRRWSPTLALAGAWAAAIVQMLLGLPPLPADLAIFGILYAAAAYGTRALYWAAFASSLVGAAVIVVYLLVPPLIERGWPSADASYGLSVVAMFVAAALALLLAWTIGALVRTGIRASENRRAQEVAEAEAAAETERTRIARDMHDVVAHSLAVVIAQADGARYAAAADPAAATHALETISTTARAALSDVRMLLTQLRHTQADGPQPTLADLEQLYAQVRGAGVELRVDVDPAPVREVPASVQLAVYRILQEALTNALRHGSPGAVDVALAWHDDRVELTVRNAASAVAPASPGADPARGHGLIGMRERAQLVGGTLEAAREGAGFRVRAVLPLGETA